MIGVVIPAHNEARLIAACLASVRCAASHPALRGEAVRLLVVLDACTDTTAAIVLDFGFEALCVEARNVGVARAAGAQALLACGARWLAFTDADSHVAPDWLAAQLALAADAVCGPVSVDDWSALAPCARAAWERRYRDADGHRHIHGANLGVAAHAYLRAGGFPPLACSEDVALVDLLIATGATLAWSAAPRVVTSGRRDARARGGFGDTLAAWADGVDDSERPVAP
ncbi:glycosyltransferase [Paraburkholderia sp. CNPSo 3076]|uniref:glycosyltransferase n=1 Tax=Paraburkholderia sp. CNPSo 3076 TaxID=2940936 RepID=UPI00224D4905|nr:glycosyltransferase family 2 protein [Paraburkholderia sp. CNPSo 3076]MCX5544342.1 glycosyltransferase [Paraburkholderia sp. CNPSo 3076]